jgi:hypothetical protein
MNPEMMIALARISEAKHQRSQPMWQHRYESSLPDTSNSPMRLRTRRLKTIATSTRSGSFIPIVQTCLETFHESC